MNLIPKILINNATNKTCHITYKNQNDSEIDTKVDPYSCKTIEGIITDLKCRFGSPRSLSKSFSYPFPDGRIYNFIQENGKIVEETNNRNSNSNSNGSCNIL